MDGVEAFHAAYAKGRMSEPPKMYVDLILVPAILHIEPLTFAAYPPAVQMQMRGLLRYYIAGGWAGNTEIVSSNA